MVIYMKKVLILLIIILLCGCEAKYELRVDDKFDENTEISIDSSDLDVKYFNQLGPIMEYYTLNDIPLSIIDKPDELVPFKNSGNVDVYKKEISLDNDKTLLSLSGSFKDDAVTIAESSVINYAGNIDVEDSDNIKNISFSFNSSLFDKYQMLDSIDVKIIDNNYRVMKDNADEVNDNVYTWTITRDNYYSKTITFSLNEKKLNIKKSVAEAKKKLDNPMGRFSIALIVITFIFLIVYIFVNMRFKSCNKL